MRQLWTRIRSKTDRIARIESILSECSVNIVIETIHFSKFRLKHIEEYIGFILSGSSYNVSDFYYSKKLKSKFKYELDLIRNCKEVPILGVCFGLHLIANVFNGQVLRMRFPGLGEKIIFILLEKPDDLITNKNICVNSRHRDFVSPNDQQILNSFEMKATSKTKRYRMIQYMRHREKPIFGLQFHPETHNASYFDSSPFDEIIVEKTRVEGEEIVCNFLQICIYQNKNPE